MLKCHLLTEVINVFDYDIQNRQRVTLNCYGIGRVFIELITNDKTSWNAMPRVKIKKSKSSKKYVRPEALRGEVITGINHTERRLQLTCESGIFIDITSGNGRLPLVVSIEVKP